MTRVERFAPAKINLTLHVTGLRADGYHLLDSLVMFADVGDRLDLRLVSPSGTPLALLLEGPMAKGIPVDGQNLVARAAALMADALPAGQGLEIVLQKNLPAGAGIGGGSSDAAATLLALADMAGVSLPAPERIAGLGADVPVCLLGAAARMRGIGEQVERVAGLPELFAVLVNPGVHVPTPEVFRALRTRENEPMAAQIPEFKTAAELIGWLAGQRNDLEQAAISVAPEIGSVLAAIRATGGGEVVRMSGSGATCFALFETRDTAQHCAARLGALYPQWWCQAVALS